MNVFNVVLCIDSYHFHHTLYKTLNKRHCFAEQSIMKYFVRNRSVNYISTITLGKKKIRYS